MSTLLTSDQFLALPDELDQNGNRIKVELIGGEVVPVPPASLLHDLIKNRINELLIDFLRANPQLDLKSLVEIGAQVSNTDAFIPDVSVVTRASISTESRIYRGSPEIAIEVVSPTDTVRNVKCKVDAYFEGGAKSVWIVFPESRAIQVFNPESIRELKADQPITDPLLPGFSPPVSAFFDLA